MPAEESSRKKQNMDKKVLSTKKTRTRQQKAKHRDATTELRATESEYQERLWNLLGDNRPVRTDRTPAKSKGRTMAAAVHQLNLLNEQIQALEGTIQSQNRRIVRTDDLLTRLRVENPDNSALLTIAHGEAQIKELEEQLMQLQEENAAEILAERNAMSAERIAADAERRSLVRQLNNAGMSDSALEDAVNEADARIRANTKKAAEALARLKLPSGYHAGGPAHQPDGGNPDGGSDGGTGGSGPAGGFGAGVTV